MTNSTVVKKIIVLILATVMCCTTLAGCAVKAEKWQKQYSLGVKYLNELDYKAAEVEFTKLLKIDPYHIQANGGLLKVALETGNTEAVQGYVDNIITGYANINQNVNQAQESMQQALEKYEQDINNATEGKKVDMDKTFADSEEFVVSIGQIQQLYDPKAFETFDDVKEEVRERVQYDNPSVKVSDDELRLKYLEEKDRWLFTEEDIRFAVEYGGWNEYDLRRSVMYEKIDYYAELAILCERMLNFIESADPVMVQRVFSGDAFVMLYEVPTVFYKNNIEWLNEPFDFGNLNVETCTESEVRDLVNYLSAIGDPNPYKNNTFKKIDLWYEFAPSAINSSYGYMRCPFDIWREIAFIQGDETIGMTEIKTYAEHLSDYPLYAWGEYEVVGSALSMYTRHIEYVAEYLKREYIYPSELEYIKLNRDIIQMYLNNSVYLQQVFDGYAELAKDEGLKNSIWHTDTIFSSADTIKNKILPAREKVNEIHADIFAYKDQVLADYANEKAAKDAEAFFKETEQLVNRTTEQLNREKDYKAWLSAELEKETDETRKTELQSEIEITKADIVIFEQRLADAQVQLEQATAAYEQAKEFLEE